MDMPDPRAIDARHDLSALPVSDFILGLCRSASFGQVAMFGRAKGFVFGAIPRLKHALPSHDTFPDVCRMINPRALDASFGKALADVALRLAIDGKALREARGKALYSVLKREAETWCQRRSPCPNCYLCAKSGDIL
jgi:hypothetical protein